MTAQAFWLIPFPAASIPDITITGTISRRNNLLTLQYSVTGSIEKIFLPLPTARPGRKAELWKQTCFEFFFAKKEGSQYWEFNLSPSGDWNVYHMDAYRRVGFREETLIHGMAIEARWTSQTFSLDGKVDLSPIVLQDHAVEVGITAVLQTQDGSETYWALTHPAPEADFHMRESFILELAAQTLPLGQSAPAG